MHEGPFGADGLLGWAVTHLALIETMRGKVEHPCRDFRPGSPGQVVLAHFGQVCHILDAPGIESLLQGRSDSGNPPQGHELDEIGLPVLWDEQHPIGFGIGRGHFGHQLVGGDAYGTGHVEVLGHGASDPSRDARR